jgi:hypothetical protein
VAEVEERQNWKAVIENLVRVVIITSRVAGDWSFQAAPNGFETLLKQV